MRAAKNRQTLDAVLGGAVGIGWFASSTALLTGTLGAILPIAGAITLTAVAPMALRRMRYNPALLDDKTALAHRLAAFDRHTMINISDRKGTLMEVNDHFAQALGYAPEAMIGMPVEQLYLSTARPMMRRIRRVLSRGETWQGQTPLRRSDGTTIYTFATAAPLYDADDTWIGSITARTDVTQINKLTSMQSSVETLNELRDDIWILNAEDLSFSYMNHTALNRLDWRQAGFRGRSLRDLADGAAARSISNACYLLQQDGKGSTHFDIELDGTGFSVALKYLPASAQPARFLMTLTDLTDLRAQERITSDFISTVSHELRSPLTSIKGSMGLLLSQAAGELPPKANDLLQIAHRNADRLVLILNDILDLEKIAAGEMDFVEQSVDLVDLIHETNDANQMMRQRFGLTIKVEGTENPICVTTDPNRIIQVLTNLLSNACKFSRPGGTITIKVEDFDETVRVSVRDEGAGIAQQDQHKIFQRFADLNNSNRTTKGGTGLGLSICKAIVEGLGGEIGFETAEGIGTTFHFALPRKIEFQPTVSASDGLLQVSGRKQA